MNKKKAFTLTELLVVVVVIGVLSAVILPKYNKVVETRKTTEAEEMMAAVRMEQEKRCSLEQPYIGDIGKLSQFIPHATTSNFEYQLEPKGMLATSRGKYNYALKMPSYADGRICCDGDECDKLNKNYLTCQELQEKPDYLESVGCDATVGACDAATRPADKVKSCTCGQVVATTYCDGTTWKYYNFPECPAKLEDETRPCETGTGTRTRTAECNVEIGAWEYGEWSDTCVAPKGKTCYAWNDENPKSCGPQPEYWNFTRMIRGYTTGSLNGISTNPEDALSDLHASSSECCCPACGAGKCRVRNTFDCKCADIVDDDVDEDGMCGKALLFKAQQSSLTAYMRDLPSPNKPLAFVSDPVTVDEEACTFQEAWGVDTYTFCPFSSLGEEANLYCRKHCNQSLETCDKKCVIYDEEDFESKNHYNEHDMVEFAGNEYQSASRTAFSAIVKGYESLGTCDWYDGTHNKHEGDCGPCENCTKRITWMGGDWHDVQASVCLKPIVYTDGQVIECVKQ